MRLIKTIVIENYLRQIVLSHKRRTFYYEKGGKKPPPAYAKPPKYDWKKLNGKYRLFNFEKNEFVIRNKATAGKIRTMNINSQKLYDQSAARFVRAKMVDQLSAFFNLHLKDIAIKDFPIALDGELHDHVIDQYAGPRWDMDGRIGVYTKVFHDCLTNNGIIPDDSQLYITKPLSFIFTPIEVAETPKMIIKFYHDTRSCIAKSPYYDPYKT